MRRTRSPSMRRGARCSVGCHRTRGVPTRMSDDQRALSSSRASAPTTSARPTTAKLPHEPGPPRRAMNGAQALIRTLVACGVDLCFTNPGTSEMHFVAALDDVPEMRAVLGLFEGVVTGAADGYGRMTGRPAATLLHLGPGLGNGIANLHNARRARTPIVNIVGDHATYHQRFDAPLQSDIESLARPVSRWFETSVKAHALAADAVRAVQGAYGPPGGVATLGVPADLSWQEAGEPLASA